MSKAKSILGRLDSVSENLEMPEAEDIENNASEMLKSAVGSLGMSGDIREVRSNLLTGRMGKRVEIYAPLDIRSTGPARNLFKSLSLKMVVTAFDRTGPKGEEYLGEIEYSYTHPGGGSNGYSLGTAWFDADLNMIAFRKSSGI